MYNFIQIINSFSITSLFRASFIIILIKNLLKQQQERKREREREREILINNISN